MSPQKKRARLGQASDGGGHAVGDSPRRIGDHPTIPPALVTIAVKAIIERAAAAVATTEVPAIR